VLGSIGGMQPIKDGSKLRACRHGDIVVQELNRSCELQHGTGRRNLQ
jgi:hypothetical protein